MDQKTNQKLQQMVARDTVKIRRVNNGYIINSEEGMLIAKALSEVIDFLRKKFEVTVDTK